MPAIRPGFHQHRPKFRGLATRYRSTRTRYALFPPRPRLVIGLMAEFGRSTRLSRKNMKDLLHVALGGGCCLLRTAAALTGAQIAYQPTSGVPRASSRSGRSVSPSRGVALQWSRRPWLEPGLVSIRGREVAPARDDLVARGVDVSEAGLCSRTSSSFDATSLSKSRSISPQ